jgi:primary-amine oxidase
MRVQCTAGEVLGRDTLFITLDEQVECEQAGAGQPRVQGGAQAPVRHRGHQPRDGRHLERGQLRLRGGPHAPARAPAVFPAMDPTDNGYAKPIEGLRPVVDLNAMKVIRVEEYGHWPLPPQAGNYAADRVDHRARTSSPWRSCQPDGPSFEVDGYQVRWQKWSFVIGFNGREGLTLNNLCYQDGGRGVGPLPRLALRDGRPLRRSGPAAGAQERVRRRRVRPRLLRQQPGARLRLPGAHQVLRRPSLHSRGEPLTIKNAVCMHEEDFGILWKHTDRRLNRPEVRRSRRLVVSSIATVENYEYGFFWYLYQDGNIQFEIKLTGILSLGALLPRRDVPLRHADRAAALRAQPPAFLQRAARPGPRRHGQHGLPGRRRGRSRRAEQTRSRTPSRAKATLAGRRSSRRAPPQPRNRPHLEVRQPVRR